MNSLTTSGRQTLKGWWIALRPQTLPASVAPVLIGGALAYQQGLWHTRAFFLALSVALLLQLAVNLANDYFDYHSGVDSTDSSGYPRACADGLLKPSSVYVAMIGLILLSLIPGGYLVYRGGLPALLVGLLSILALLGYSGGPLPYGSYALGDVMVFLFFGIAATAGTVYVQYCSVTDLSFPLSLPPDFPLEPALLVSIPPGALSTAILVINNLRDREDDRAAGKKTLAVLLGRKGSLLEFGLLIVAAYLTPLLLIDRFDYAVMVGLPLVSLPLGILIYVDLARTTSDEALNQLLEQTGRLLFLYSLLFALGLILAS